MAVNLRFLLLLSTLSFISSTLIISHSPLSSLPSPPLTNPLFSLLSSLLSSHSLLTLLLSTITHPLTLASPNTHTYMYLSPLPTFLHSSETVLVCDLLHSFSFLCVLLSWARAVWHLTREGGGGRDGRPIVVVLGLCTSKETPSANADILQMQQTLCKIYRYYLLPWHCSNCTARSTGHPSSIWTTSWRTSYIIYSHFFKPLGQQ